MKNTLLLSAVFLINSGLALSADDKLPAPLVSGLVSPESAATGPDGKIYVSVIGEFNKDGDGAILTVDGGKAVEFAKGLDDPKGLANYQGIWFVADKTQIRRIDAQGNVEVFAPADAFPSPPRFLNDLVADPESGTLYVSDSGDLAGKEGAVYRITPQGKVSVVTDQRRWPKIHTPNGLLLDSAMHLLVGDFGTGELHRVKISDGSAEKLAAGFGAFDGLARDYHGRLFASDWTNGRVYAIGRPGDKPVLLADGLQSAADLCLDAQGKRLIVPDMKAGTLIAIDARVPGADVDETPLPMETTLAFGQLKWTGWEGVSEEGTVTPLRPIVLTHAGDGSNRVFVATQHGVVHVFPNDQQATETAIFLDMQDRVSYNDNMNEEGFLGLAFHPKFKENGELFVFYTTNKEKLTNIVSRFRVSKDDPNVVDPASEEVLLKFKKPFWNHDGGTICFGPDGYLYATHGDGGAANDPYDNGQSLKTWLGKVLRIDVDRRDAGKPYAVPKDNPFVKTKGAQPEIWAYGLRNIWRMAFDRQTGTLWAGDVGQNLWEEVVLVTAGGNYGWNRRESLHPFGAKGTGPRKEYIEPIWEYHHDIGKSITGGAVYRGQRLSELAGAYLYADYVSGRIWALWYDESQNRVTANRPIQDRALPIMSFGEDEQGEIYLLTYSATGEGIYWFNKLP